MERPQFLNLSNFYQDTDPTRPPTKRRTRTLAASVMRDSLTLQLVYFWCFVLYSSSFTLDLTQPINMTVFRVILNAPVAIYLQYRQHRKWTRKSTFTSVARSYKKSSLKTGRSYNVWPANKQFCNGWASELQIIFFWNSETFLTANIAVERSIFAPFWNYSYFKRKAVLNLVLTFI